MDALPCSNIGRPGINYSVITTYLEVLYIHSSDLFLTNEETRYRCQHQNTLST